jgi:hypothetical protein
MMGGVYFLMAVQWDFLWFVLNPHFGMRRFSAAHIPWFRIWFLGLPADYYNGLLLSLLCWLAVAWLEGTRVADRAWHWLLCLLTLLALTLAALIWARVTRQSKE